MIKESTKESMGCLFGLVILFLIGYALFNGLAMSRNFKQRDETVVTLAHIESGFVGYKSKIFLQFWYMVGNERIDNESAEISLSPRIIQRLWGKTIPMVYLKNNPQRFKLLLTEYAFKSTNLPFPDSLNWLKEYKSW